MGLAWTVLLIFIAYLTGSAAEEVHFKRIKRREKATLHVPIVNFGSKHPIPMAQEAQLCVGSVVVSIDYFKRLLGNLRGIFGGRIRAYESLMDRGRREAILRMKEQAIAFGANQIVNLRIETSTIGGVNQDGKGLGAVEVVAYGTGVR